MTFNLDYFQTIGGIVYAYLSSTVYIENTTFEDINSVE
jgi:hypothetical protein